MTPQKVDFKNKSELEKCFKHESIKRLPVKYGCSQICSSRQPPHCPLAVFIDLLWNCFHISKQDVLTNASWCMHSTPYLLVIYYAGQVLNFLILPPTPFFLILGMLLFFKISKWRLLLCLWKCRLLPHQANSTSFCTVRTIPSSQSLSLGLTSLYRFPHGSFVFQYFLTSVILFLEVGQGLASNSLHRQNECSECLTPLSPHPKD